MFILIITTSSLFFVYYDDKQMLVIAFLLINRVCGAIECCACRQAGQTTAVITVDVRSADTGRLLAQALALLRPPRDCSNPPFETIRILRSNRCIAYLSTEVRTGGRFESVRTSRICIAYLPTEVRQEGRFDSTPQTIFETSLRRLKCREVPQPPAAAEQQH